MTNLCAYVNSLGKRCTLNPNVKCRGLENTCGDYKPRYGEPLTDCKHWDEKTGKCNMLKDGACRWTSSSLKEIICGFYPKEKERRRKERLNGSKLYCSGKDYNGVLGKDNK